MNTPEPVRSLLRKREVTKVRTRALTMPQRLTAALAVLDVESYGRVLPAAGVRWSEEALFVIPTLPMTSGPEVGTSNESRILERVAAAEQDAVRPTIRKARVTLHTGVELDALAMTGVGPQRARSIVNTLDGVSHYWIAADGRAALLSTEGTRSLPVGENPDEQAARLGTGDVGAVLSELGAAQVLRAGGVSRWTTARRPGWRQGGPLHVGCPRCDEPLAWADWWNADATRMRRSALVFCPSHGSPAEREVPGLGAMVAARRQLDSALWMQDARKKARVVYAFDMDGPTSTSVYVGETGTTAQERREVHRSGGPKAGRIFRSGKARPGELRTDVPPLPTLHTVQASRAAEQLVALWFRLRGFDVHGDG